MTIPDYWLSLPEFDVEPHRNDFELALAEAVKTGVGQVSNAPYGRG